MTKKSYFCQLVIYSIIFCLDCYANGGFSFSSGNDPKYLFPNYFVDDLDAFGNTSIEFTDDKTSFSQMVISGDSNGKTELSFLPRDSGKLSDLEKSIAGVFQADGKKYDISMPPTFGPTLIALKLGKVTAGELGTVLNRLSSAGLVPPNLAVEFFENMRNATIKKRPNPEDRVWDIYYPQTDSNGQRRFVRISKDDDGLLVAYARSHNESKVLQGRAPRSTLRACSEARADNALADFDELLLRLISPPDKVKEVYRGGMTNDDYTKSLMGLGIGSDFTINHHMSTSMSAKIASQFISGYAMQVLLNKKCPEQAVDISPFNRGSEQEVIIRKGTKLRLIKREQGYNIVVFHLEVVCHDQKD